ncbi:MAG: histidine kinase dimerization/phospho-acceptor domain-containing protein, partial [Variovorax sp.]
VRPIGLISAARSALRARDRQYQVRLADQRKDEFLATLAHELRNPLAPIRTSMSILRRLPPPAKVAQIVEVVDRQVVHLTRLVDDLLDVARISTGKVELQARRTTVRSVLTHALEISSSAIQDKGHRLKVTQPDGEFSLNADHARVVQSVANLLVNAAKFTPEHGEIELGAEVDGDTVRFRVKDNGRGLQEQSKGQIFDLFAQAPLAGELASGLGIGLISAARSALRARDRQYQVRLADQRKDEFLATLAHELRNPLAPIRTSMSILRRRPPPAKVAQIVEVVDRQVVHLTRLVDDLLDVARISTGKVELQARRTTVRSVLTHAL